MRLADTNILIYAADTSPEERVKRARAAEVLKEDDLSLSTQVLQEFYHQATRPRGRTWDDPRAGPGIPGTPDGASYPTGNPGSVQDGLGDGKNGIVFSYWDAAILAAARMLGCDAVYSEDLNDGQFVRQRTGDKPVPPERKGDDVLSSAPASHAVGAACDR